MVMKGITVKPASISSAMKNRARRWLASRSVSPMAVRGWARSASLMTARGRWPRKGGNCFRPSSSSGSESAAIRKNGARQPNWVARNSDSGTPATVDTENAAMMVPLARPRRSNGIRSPTMVCTIEPSTPPKAPAMARAASSVA